MGYKTENRTSCQIQAGIGHSAPAHRDGHVQNRIRRREQRWAGAEPNSRQSNHEWTEDEAEEAKACTGDADGGRRCPPQTTHQAQMLHEWVLQHLTVPLLSRLRSCSVHEKYAWCLLSLPTADAPNPGRLGNRLSPVSDDSLLHRARETARHHPRRKTTERKHQGRRSTANAGCCWFCCAFVSLGGARPL